MVSGVLFGVQLGPHIERAILRDNLGKLCIFDRDCGAETSCWGFLSTLRLGMRVYAERVLQLDLIGVIESIMPHQ